MRETARKETLTPAGGPRQNPRNIRPLRAFGISAVERMSATDAKHESVIHIGVGQTALIVLSIVGTGLVAYMGLSDQLGGRIDALGARLDSVDGRFDSVDRRFDSVDRRFDSLRSDMREDHAAMREYHATMREDHAAMREDHAAMRNDINVLQVGLGRVETRLDHVERRLGPAWMSGSRSSRYRSPAHERDGRVVPGFHELGETPSRRSSGADSWVFIFISSQAV